MSTPRRHGWLLSLLGAVVLTTLLAAPTALAADATQRSNTRLTVLSFVTLAGVPSIIDFGSGIPGSALSGPDLSSESPARSSVAPGFVVMVRTNNSTGFELVALTSDMGSGSPAEAISASQIAYTVNAQDWGHADGGTVVAEAVALRLAHSYERSDVTGDHFAITPSVVIPFVRSGTYQGTVTFVVVEL